MTNRTELELARWLGSHGAAVALQATLGASASVGVAYLSYELFEKRFLQLKPLFEAAKEPMPESPLRWAPPECQASTWTEFGWFVGFVGLWHK